MQFCSISNIAWDAADDEEALDLAAELGFTGIEIAPAKLFGPLDNIDPATVKAYRARLNARGFVVPAMQAILFGVADVHLFADANRRTRLAQRLEQVAVLAEHIGAHACVFGAPALRDPGDLTATASWTLAVEFFSQIADVYARRGLALCFEANPSLYNCRFVTRTDEAIRLVEDVGKHGFALQLDTGTAFINGETSATVRAAARLAAHCHISEPNLNPVGSTDVDHQSIALAIAQACYAGWRSVEMRASPNWRDAMRGAAVVMQHCYDRPSSFSPDLGHSR